VAVNLDVFITSLVRVERGDEHIGIPGSPRSLRARSAPEWRARGSLRRRPRPRRTDWLALQWRWEDITYW